VHIRVHSWITLFVFSSPRLCVSGASVKPILSRKLKGVYLGMTR
jgi:hypothetical protein